MGFSLDAFLWGWAFLGLLLKGKGCRDAMKGILPCSCSPFFLF